MNLARLHKPTKDEAHEERIQECAERWMAGEKCWPELAQLIEHRSADQIARMEAAKGLRR